MASSGRLLVAAIDFGTTYSGYAFSFQHEFESDPLKVSASTWTAGSRALVSHKAPTIVLLDKNQTFHSFGYEAEDHYSQLAEDDDHTEWYYFRRFKMMLYGKDGKGGLSTHEMLKDIHDRELPALKVFSEGIKYLKGHLLKALAKRAIDVKDTDIEWVLTVPAIWNDPARQFMRHAAEQAGIKGDQLIIALGSEAASLYCKHLPVEKMGGSEQGFTCFSNGSKYLLLNAGAVTVGVCSFENGDVCFLAQRNDDDFDWTIRTGNTPSSSTGPSAAFSGDYYAYIEASSPRVQYDRAVYSVHLGNTAEERCLTFAYHMYGDATGTLSVTYTDNQQTTTV